MCTDGVRNVRDGNRIDSFVRRRSLDEYLIVQVVIILAYEDMDVTHYLQYIKTLLQSLTRKMNLSERKAILD